MAGFLAMAVGAIAFLLLIALATSARRSRGQERYHASGDGSMMFVDGGSDGGTGGDCSPGDAGCSDGGGGGGD